MADQLKLAGTIKQIGEVQTFNSGFTKLEFILTTDGKYPQDVKFEVVKDKCDELVDDLSEGMEATIYFDVRGNEYKGKYYVNLQAWKWEAGEGFAGEENVANLEEDDIPF